MTEIEDEEFAYGHWYSGEALCPLEAAGLSNDEWATEVAEDFDDLVRTMLGLDGTNGVISKEDAEIVWEQLSETTEAEALDNHYEHKQKLELIEAVEKEVFSND